TYFPIVSTYWFHGFPFRNGTDKQRLTMNATAARIVHLTNLRMVAAESVRLFGCVGSTSRRRGSISNSGPLALSDKPHNGIFEVAVTRTRVFSSRRCVTSRIGVRLV